jgi:hypothetical protein
MNRKEFSLSAEQVLGSFNKFDRNMSISFKKTVEEWKSIPHPGLSPALGASRRDLSSNLGYP